MSGEEAVRRFTPTGEAAISPDAVRGPGRAHPLPPAGEPTEWVRHNRVRLALHRLREARGEAATGEGTTGDPTQARPLLLLHGLGERIGAETPAEADAWPGEVWGLDFTGHGWSTVPHSGGYTAELLMGDVDAALARLGPTTVWGRGLGAYVALLTAGGRPTLVRGAVLSDGPGISGGGIGPGGSRITIPPSYGTTPDPFALAELTVDLRPPDYAVRYFEQAVEFSGLTEPVSLCGVVRPPWLAALEGGPGAIARPAAEALAVYARCP